MSFSLRSHRLLRSSRATRRKRNGVASPCRSKKTNPRSPAMPWPHKERSRDDLPVPVFPSIAICSVRLPWGITKPLRLTSPSHTARPRLSLPSVPARFRKRLSRFHNALNLARIDQQQRFSMLDFFTERPAPRKPPQDTNRSRISTLLIFSIFFGLITRSLMQTYHTRYYTLGGLFSSLFLISSRSRAKFRLHIVSCRLIKYCKVVESAFSSANKIRSRAFSTALTCGDCVEDIERRNLFSLAWSSNTSTFLIGVY